MSDSDDDSVTREPTSKRSRPGFRMVDGQEIEERDYYHVLPLVQMIYDDWDNADDMNDSLESFFELVMTINPQTFRAKSLQTFIDATDPQFSFLPDSIFSLDALETLTISYTPLLKALPSGIEKLQNLVELEMIKLSALTELPAEISQLSSLKELTIQENECLVTLPDNLPPNLRLLDLTETPIRTLPANIGNLKKLEIFKASFHHFTELPESFGLLNSLKRIDTDVREPFQCPLDAAVLELPILHEIRMNLWSVRCLRPCTWGPHSLCLTYHLTENMETTEKLPDLESIFEWERLERIEFTMASHTMPDNSLYFDASLFGGFAYFSKAKDLCISFFGRRCPDDPEDSFQVFLQDAPCLKNVEKLELEGLTILQHPSELKQRACLENLKSLDLRECTVDPGVLPNLVVPRLEILFLELGWETSNEDLHIICTKWLSQMPLLADFRVYSEGITEISDSSIEVLKGLKLRRMELPYSFFWKDAERKLLPLVEACQFLGGGLDISQTPSRRIRWLMHMNEARAKVLGGQPVPETLWPKIMESATRAFTRKKTSNSHRKMLSSLCYERGLR